MLRAVLTARGIVVTQLDVPGIGSITWGGIGLRIYIIRSTLTRGLQ